MLRDIGRWTSAELVRGPSRLLISKSFHKPVSENLLYCSAHSTVRQLGLDFQERLTRPAKSAELLALSTAQCRGRRVKNIFVGNLSFNTNEDELRQIFEPFGQVDRVSIMTDRDTGRSRGFGFVEMASNEDGDKAITALNGSSVGGRTINVNEARPKTERSGGVGGGGGGRDRGDRGGRGGAGGGRRDRY
jgi:cold-inducible RNA-binding protein